MPRPRRFTDDQVLDATRDLLADPQITRPTIAQISRQSGIHTGSIYLRFASRDELLARLWLRSIQRFHVGLIEALQAPDPLVQAALHQSRYCRAHPTEARAMKMFHREQLLGIGPAQLQDDLQHVNDAMNAAFGDAVEATFGSRDPQLQAWAYTAAKAIPYGLIRDFIAHAQPIPDWIDDMVQAAVSAVLRLEPTAT
ncbi:TetR/AcrR family transcriptional regulator [Microlunatus elymi]|uniref:TetR/AcrR family transcriptional regulator n=1 Tax=Microlunatus elymi TaxID=2596828 RepID=A0A516Q0K7_9ACTN|nr:TetR/AcrR family transcriptional regulator [Microlunatus elymi]QDP96938.1 TetR/AcrR family transcriptional regulator [Microlunatus elymi]